MFDVNRWTDAGELPPYHLLPFFLGASPVFVLCSRHAASVRERVKGAVELSTCCELIYTKGDFW